MRLSRSGLADTLLRRWQELKGAKANFDSHYQEIIDYMMPYRQGITSQVTPGSKTMGLIHDSSPILSHFMFAAGLHGMMTNPASKWFSLRVGDEELDQVQQVKWWLWEVERRMFQILNDPNTNFGTQVHEAYLDYGGFGMFCMFMGEDADTVCYFNNLSLGQVVCGEDFRGRVDTIIRRYPMTARQVMQEWPDCSEPVKKKAADKPEEPVDILHAVYPRAEYNPNNRTASQMPWGSTYLECATRHLLSEKGFNEFPYLAPRFSVATDEVYGRGPGMIALPDTKQLNQMEQDIMRAAQKKINPPVMMVRDSFTGPVRFTPGGVTYVRGTSTADKMEPMPVPGDLGYGEQKGEAKRVTISRIFYNDMLRVVEKDRQTAAEFLGRRAENLQLMGPMLGRLQTEFLDPLIHRLFGIMLRQRLLPPPPRMLAGRYLKTQFVSPLAKAQRLAEGQGILRTLEMVLPAANLKPDILDNFDWDQTVRHLADINAVPAVLLRAPEDIAMAREARANQIQQQLAQQQLAQAGETVGKMAPALGQAPQEGSPMQKLLKVVGGEEGA